MGRLLGRLLAGRWDLAGSVLLAQAILATAGSPGAAAGAEYPAEAQHPGRDPEGGLYQCWAFTAGVLAAAQQGSS